MRFPRLRLEASRRDTRHRNRVIGIAVAAAGALAGAAGVAAVGFRFLRRPRPLEGCVAVVAGTDPLLGHELARELGRHGARLALLGGDALDEARADLRERGMEAETIACDLSSRRDVERAIAEITARLGPIDLLVNDGTPLWGVVHTTDAVIPSMRERKEGHIVNVTTRYASVGYSEGLEADLRPRGVRVTTVLGGRIEPEAARDAARRVVSAIQRGERVVTLGWTARLARLAHVVSAPLASTLLEGKREEEGEGERDVKEAGEGVPTPA